MMISRRNISESVSGRDGQSPSRRRLDLVHRPQLPPRIAAEVERNIRILRIEIHSLKVLKKLIPKRAWQFLPAPRAKGNELKNRAVVKN